MCKLSRGERFKDARIVHNKNGKQSMDEVYSATHVAASMIKDLEDDDKVRSVGYDKVATLAQHYGVSADYLLGLTDDPSMSPRATDDLGLSVNAIRWLSLLANSPDKHRYTKHLSTLLEMDSFQSLVYLLIEYFSALEASFIGGNILRDFTSASPVLYPNSKTYFEKLKAASEDPQYDGMTQLYLEAFMGFEKAFLNTGMSMVLDEDDNEDNVIHVLDIVELKIKRNLETLLRTIESNYD